MAESFQPLNRDRYVAVGYPVRQDGGSKVAYPVLDLVAGKVALPELSTGPDITRPPHLVYYDAQKGTAGLFNGYGGGAKEYRYSHWDLASGNIDWSVPVGTIEPHTGVRPIGVDPEGRYFYFLKETVDGDEEAPEFGGEKRRNGGGEKRLSVVTGAFRSAELRALAAA
jgi:hypothetical protein